MSNKVDIVILVKKESIKDEFLKRVYEEIPVNQLIIIEGSSLRTVRKNSILKGFDRTVHISRR